VGVQAQGDGVNLSAVAEHVNALLGALHVFFPGGEWEAVELFLGDAVKDG
jgi:hypothetical protein